MIKSIDFNAILLTRGTPKNDENGFGFLVLRSARRNFLSIEPLPKVFFCGSTSSPQEEKLNNFSLSPFTLSLSKGKLRNFAGSSI